MGMRGKLLKMMEFSLADLAGGLLLANLITLIFNLKLSFSICLLGMILAVLPDFDLLLQKIVEGEVRCDHRKYLHHPLITLLLAATIWLAVGPFWAALWTACLFWHFVHDSIGWHLVWWWFLSSSAHQLFVKKGGRLFIVYRLDQKEIAERNVLSVADHFTGQIPISWHQLFIGICLFVFAALLAVIRNIA